MKVYDKKVIILIDEYDVPLENAHFKDLTEYFEIPDKFSVIKEWYDGYRFGTTEIYIMRLLKIFSLLSKTLSTFFLFAARNNYSLFYLFTLRCLILQLLNFDLG